MRKFLAEVPKRPKPPKINKDLLASWGIKGNEAVTLIRVIKALGLIGAANEPTEHYTNFMRAGTGPSVLAQRIREVYKPLFEASLEPQKDAPDALRNLFNIHSGGAKTTMDYQIQTFKALSDNADFAGTSAQLSQAAGGSSPASSIQGRENGGSAVTALSVHIDLHIHLPENKTSRDYQYIIQDIARFIYQHPEVPSGATAE